MENKGMIRSTLAVIAGYAVMAAWVMISLGVAFLILGEKFIFQADSNTVTGGWLAVEMTLALIGAVMGGMVAVLISRDHSPIPVYALAGLVVVLGVGMAAADLMLPGDRPAQVTGKEDSAQVTALAEPDEPELPAWHGFTLPVIGGAGVLLGGKLKRR